jgi:hypothetical protein
VDYRIARAGDEIRWIEARGIVSYDSNGQPRRVIGISIDVTERKRAEQHQISTIMLTRPTPRYEAGS